MVNREVSDGPQQAARSTVSAAEAEEVNSDPGRGPLFLLRELQEQGDDRKQKLLLLQEFFSSPTFFDLRREVVPTSSSPEEILQRRGELEYRIDLLKALLEVMEGELALLLRAAPVEGKAAAGESKT